MGLNPKQQSFVDYYCVHKNATQAAKEAGYSEKTAGKIGSENLQKPEIRAAIDKQLTEISHDLKLDAKYVIDRLMEVVERSLQKKPVMEFDHEEKRMVETGQWEFDSAGANRALELLGKNLKLFTDKLEVDDKSSLADKLNRFKSRGKP